MWAPNPSPIRPPGIPTCSSRSWRRPSAPASWRGRQRLRRVAKAMIQEGRPAATRSERMILNNYRGMLLVRDHRQGALTPEFVFALQRMLTESTMDDPSGAGRFRRADEHIVVEDETGTILHHPPHADELPQRLAAMCDFANGTSDTEFLPPSFAPSCCTSGWPTTTLCRRQRSHRASAVLLVDGTFRLLVV